MTTQTTVFSGLPTGLTLTKKVFTVADPDTEVTGITGSVTERTNALGQYVVAVTKAAVITGDHTIILFVGSSPIAIGKRTFVGTDAEVATVTPEVAELNTAGVDAIADEVQTRTIDVNVIKINGDVTSAMNLALSAGALGIGVVGIGSTISSIVVDTCSITSIDMDQFKGRSIVFLRNTITPALRGQATAIIASNNNPQPIFTVVNLTIAPSNNDMFIIV